MPTKHLKGWRPNRRIDGAACRSNIERANAAERAIEFYLHEKGEKEAAVLAVTDLLADLYHYVASQGLEPEAAHKTALMHFEAER